MDRERFSYLLACHADSVLTPEELQELENQLLHSAEARRVFWEHANLSTLLREAAQLESGAEMMGADDFKSGGELSRVDGPRRALVAPANASSPTAIEPAERELSGPVLPANKRGTVIGLSPFRTWGVGSLVVVLLMVFGLGALTYWQRGNSSVEQASPRVASIVSSTDALWSGPSVPDSTGWLPGGSVQLRRGQVEIRFVSGVIVMLKGPAEFQAISAIEADLKQGSITARVSGGATSFRIRTPTAKVIDLGTEFGLSVDASGETDVAVFDGKVDVSSEPDSKSADVAQTQIASAASPRRLTAGEALRVNWDGEFRRIVTVTDASFPALERTKEETKSSRPSLVSSVSDTLRNGDDNPKFYRIVSNGFGEDVPAYVDRNYEWNGIDDAGIPECLLGAEYIMPFNNDKAAKDFEVTIKLERSAIVYVLFDDRGSPPNWLKEAFVNTGLDVGLDEGPHKKVKHELGHGPGESIDYKFSVWKREVKEAGPLVLGPRGGARTGRAMYGIVVAPLEAP